MKTIYLIGSLRNPRVPEVAAELRKCGFEVFDDWYAAGPEADDKWQEYELFRGHSFSEALQGHAASHVFEYDRFHLNRAHAGVLVYPAGKSAHIEMGYLAGQGKPCFALLEGEPDRSDVMKRFASGGVFTNKKSMINAMYEFDWEPNADIPKVTIMEAAWIAGILEGEGSFVCDSMNGKSRPRPRIAVQMTDEDVMRRLAGLLGARLYGPYKRAHPRKPVWAIGITGPVAIEWMRVLKVYMGARRQAQIADVMSRWSPRDYRRWR